MLCSNAWYSPRGYSRCLLNCSGKRFTKTSLTNVLVLGRTSQGTPTKDLLYIYYTVPVVRPQRCCFSAERDELVGVVALLFDFNELAIAEGA